MIRSCACIHLGQDKLHGKGMRVHNRTRKVDGQERPDGGWRCIVCLKTTARSKDDPTR